MLHSKPTEADQFNSVLLITDIKKIIALKKLFLKANILKDYIYFIKDYIAHLNII